MVVATEAGMQHLVKLWLLSIVLILQQAMSCEAEDGWHSIMMRLPELDGQQFRDQVAEPLVQLSANAYRYPDVIDVPGWVPSSIVAPVAPSEGGVHALVYEEENGGADGRIVLAFRGTQLEDTRDSAADMCADVLLWGEGLSSMSLLPASCAIFDNATLDYFSQAVSYTRQVRGAYPSASLLLTGHSLGAGLAILVSASLSSYPAIPVIAFGSPGTTTALQAWDLKLTVENEKRIFIIADQWDEILRTSWYKQVGTLCLYNHELSTACEKCFGSSTGLFREVLLRRSMLQKHTGVDSCKICFLQTHYMAKLILTVTKGTRPLCQPHDSSIT